MAELHHDRQIAEAFPQLCQVVAVGRGRVKRVRELREHAGELARVHQRRERGHEPGEIRLFALVRQPLERLHREPEAVRRPVRPALDEPRRGHTVVGGVDLDRGELAGIEGELLAAGRPAG